MTRDDLDRLAAMEPHQLTEESESKSRDSPHFSVGWALSPCA